MTDTLKDRINELFDALDLDKLNKTDDNKKLIRTLKRKSTLIKNSLIKIFDKIDYSIYNITGNKHRNFRLFNNTKYGKDNMLCNFDNVNNKDLDITYNCVYNKILKQIHNINLESLKDKFKLNDIRDSLLTYNQNILITPFNDTKFKRVDNITNKIITENKIDDTNKKYVCNNIHDAVNIFNKNINVKFWNDDTNKKFWNDYLYINYNHILPKKTTSYGKINSLFLEEAQIFNYKLNEYSKNNGGTGSYDNMNFLLKRCNDTTIKKIGFNRLNKIFNYYNKDEELIFKKNLTKSIKNDLTENIDFLNIHINLTKDKLEHFLIIHNKLKDKFYSLEDDEEIREFIKKYNFNLKFIYLKDDKNNYLFNFRNGKLSINPIFDKNKTIIKEDKTFYKQQYLINKNLDKYDDIDNYKDITYNYKTIDDIQAIQNDIVINTSIFYP